MIGRLVGTLVDSSAGLVTVDVVGVGYEVHVPIGSLGRSGGDSAPGARVTLHIHTHVREDSLELFGFGTPLEREVFRLLIGVPNVGPRSALTILGDLPPAELADAIRRQDMKRLTAVSGVGKKTAERLVLELGDKLDKLGDFGSSAPGPTKRHGEAERLASALTNMGYRPAEADRAVRALSARIGQEPFGELIKAALAELA